MSGKSWRHEKAGCHEKANVGTSRVSRKSEGSGNQCVRKSEGVRKKQGVKKSRVSKVSGKSVKTWPM